MNLESLTMTDLAALRDHLSAAAEAGDILAEAGLIPTFAISDTRPLLTVPPLGAMPVRAVAEAAPFAPRRADLVKDGPARLPAPRYSEEDMRRAVTMLCDLTEGGMSRMDAYDAIGAELGRQPKAIANRFCGQEWSQALTDEVSRRAAASTPAAPPSPPAPARSIYEDPLVQRITGLKMPPQWDHAADKRMLALAAKGLDAATIAVNLEVAPKIVTGRLTQLTNGGMYPAAELLTAVEAILGEQRKGVAA